AGAAVCLFLDERFQEARAEAAAARLAAEAQTARERGHVEAIALLTGGKTAEAEAAMRAHLAAYPRDLVILQRLYFLLFWQGPFVHLGWFRDHLLWHLALMHLACGGYDRARALAREVFELAPSSIAGDLHDSISLLWRFELYGRPQGGAWAPFAAIARERVRRPGLPSHAAPPP